MELIRIVRLFGFILGYIYQTLLTLGNIFSIQRSTTMTELTKEINPQAESPLFNRLPSEIRNHIFRLAVTAYEDRDRKYRLSAFYYRSGHTCVHRIDTSLLRTCRLVYEEAARLPASINELTCWFYRGPTFCLEPFLSLLNDRPDTLIRQQELRQVHIFAQQYWLEGGGGNMGPVAGFSAFLKLWDYTHPTHLTITIRHTDWWWWEWNNPIALDPKQERRADPENYRSLTEPIAPGSWGGTLGRLSGLQVFEMELETVEIQKGELDAIADMAKGWRFPLHDGKVLILDQTRTRRTGWVGAKLSELARTSGHHI